MAWALTYLLLMIATPDSFLRDCKRHVIKSLPLTQELSAELFAQNGIGAFRFSAALIEFSQSELEGLQKIWVQAYKNAWHVPWSTANSLYTIPT